MWPVLAGKLTRPPKRDIFYIPQRPYLSIGTLRDQIIYPDTLDDMKNKQKSDSDLQQIMLWVNLANIVEVTHLKKKNLKYNKIMDL